MSTRVTLTGNWGRLREITSFRGFQRRLRSAGRKAMRDITRMAEAAIKKQMRSGVRPPDSPLTVALKGKQSTLREMHVLVNSVDHKVAAWYLGFAGFLHGGYVSASWGGKDATRPEVARALHDGTAFRVTPKMRTLFKMLSLASLGQLEQDDLGPRAAELYERARDFDWQPLGAATTHIIVPGRPFIPGALDRIRMMVRDRFALALVEAVDRQAAWSGRRGTGGGTSRPRGSGGRFI